MYIFIILNYVKTSKLINKNYFGLLSVNVVVNKKRCDGSVKCGSYNFCVGFEGNKVYCYGSQNKCLWRRNDCITDEDCKKYTSSSPKFTDGDDLNCSKKPSRWRRDACTCDEKREGGWGLCGKFYTTFTPGWKKALGLHVFFQSFLRHKGWESDQKCNLFYTFRWQETVQSNEKTLYTCICYWGNFIHK